MNRPFWVAGALCAFAASAAAQSSVTLYGVIDLALRQVKNTGAGSIVSATSSGNSSSRLGFRGSEDLGGGLSAHFVLESDVFPDTGQAGNAVNPIPVPAGQFWSRQSWVSLRYAGFGEVRLGRDYTPAFMVFAAHDPFGYIGVGAVANMLSSSQTVPMTSAFGASSVVSANTTVRANNTFNYLMPNLGGLVGQFMVAPGEGAASTGATGNSKFISGRLGYVRGPIDVQVGGAKTDNTLVAGQSFKQWSFGAAYNFGFVKLALDTTQVKHVNAKSQVSYLALTAPLGQGTLKASVAQADQSGTTTAGVSIDGRDANQVAIGYVYDLSRRTALYGTAARVANEGAVAGFSVPGGPAFVAGTDRKSIGVEFGLRHTF